jgi:hypothetical protein
MDIVTPEDIAEWLRIDPFEDIATVKMLVASAIDIIESETGRVLRPYVHAISGETIAPPVPESLKHAVAVFVAAHFDDRSGDTAPAMMTLKRLCRPYWVPHL